MTSKLKCVRHGKNPFLILRQNLSRDSSISRIGVLSIRVKVSEVRSRCLYTGRFGDFTFDEPPSYVRST